MFVVELRQLAKSSEYRMLEEDMVRDSDNGRNIFYNS